MRGTGWRPRPSRGNRAEGGRAPPRPCARRAAGRRRPQASRRIVARAPLAGDEGVGAGAAAARVVAPSTAQLVVARLAAQRGVAYAALEPVVPRSPPHE